MFLFQRTLSALAITLGFFETCLTANTAPLPKNIQQIMDQSKYDHALWGLYVKDLETDHVVFDLNSDKFFSPASTTKLFTMSALLNTFGNDYRFKTPIYALGTVDNGELKGDLVLVAQGDLTFGGRQSTPNTLSYTKLDHTIANEVPGVILTKENPLNAVIDLAKQIYDHGIRKVSGDIVIDDRLFERNGCNTHHDQRKFDRPCL
jgi:D-alanyl-D-alanine carboxypeptidase/D-alanyl-D-alanine-endopeptidase (penicillin-binding protein 4)